MKKSENNKQVLYFDVVFSKTVIALMIAVVILCFIGIGVSIWRIAHFGIKEFIDVIKYPFLIAVCVFAIVLVICVWTNSKYVIKDKTLTLCYGFIRSKYDVKDITAISQDNDERKLSVHFGESFMIITISKEGFETFVRALLAMNPDIDYSFTFSNDTPKTE